MRNRMFIRTALFAGFGLALVLGFSPRTQAPPPALAQQDPQFPRPAALEPTIEFWRNVYSAWSESEVVFHDRDDLGIVYEKMWQERSDDRQRYAENEAEQERKMAEIRAILLDLAVRNPDPRTLRGDASDVYEAFDGRGSPARWRQAAERIRVQRGLKERFHRGLLHAGQYRPHILRIFREEGVPAELAWLPMVESTFNLAARSSVGAAGVWQFMPATGREYMRVDGTVDERLDPILAARGAARLLKHNYRGLGTWPLAITAYNHGYYGMLRAVREVGTRDYMTIRRLYTGPAFGFASKNFYAEFLAALEAAEGALKYFGPTEALPSIEFDTVPMPIAMSLRDAAAAVQIGTDRLWRLNPSLTDAVWRGQRNVPAGFVLRVPPGYGRDADSQLASAAAARGGRVRPLEPAGSTPVRFHTVRRGDTLSSIASRYGVSVGDLVAINDLRDRNTIRVGQRIQVAR